MRNFYFGLIVGLLIVVASCSPTKQKEGASCSNSKEGKVVVYQVFTRLFGNKNATNKPWGTIEENGVGKFNDFNDLALEEIKKLGITHVWYTGVPHHALMTNYSAYGISNDDPDVVKGRAGSPYAVKDYYNVNPDLATDPAKILDEFKALVERTHKHGLKVVIDIVPNHVARHYQSMSNPKGTEDFGASDDKTVEYARNNNFYYIPNKPFQVPIAQNGYKPLGGDKHPLADSQFEENPAKWTGNGSRLAQPKFDDWYETVKINYGIKPDGSKDFDSIPSIYATKDVAAHFEFWYGKTVPSSWIKFRDIALYWQDMGVDGFRFDMAEMVPVEFWSFMNSSIKHKNPQAFILAEVYNPAQYRNYINIGKMDYLYDKVAMYDTLKNIMQGRGSVDHVPAIQTQIADIEHHMLHFLENHDEQRLASPEFAGNGAVGKPAMVVSATISTAPTMIYFGQEVGEAGELNSGFGSHSRTSIFDYTGVPNHQRWMNGGKFDGALLSAQEKSLRDFYVRLLNFTKNSSALMGKYEEIQALNRSSTANYGKGVLSFVRWSDSEKLIIVSNFDKASVSEFILNIPADIITSFGLTDGEYSAVDQLYGASTSALTVKDGKGTLNVVVQPLESFIYKVK